MSYHLQLDRVVLSLDRNLGNKIVPDILRENGINCEIHDKHLAPDAPDTHWIELCSKAGWIAITKDNGLRHNPPARNAIDESSVMIFTVTAKNLTGEQMGNFLVTHMERILRFVSHTPRPFLATISASGTIARVK